MDKKKWIKKIKKQCEDAGTYQKHHDPIIDTLAGILEKRDMADEQYINEGAKPIIEHISDRNQTKSYIKNPALQIIIDLNNQALQFWRDLGLTPAGFKKLNGDALTAKATTQGFEALLAKIGD